MQQLSHPDNQNERGRRHLNDLLRLIAREVVRRIAADGSKPGDDERRPSKSPRSNLPRLKG
jgi:hypothetical protein